MYGSLLMFLSLLPSCKHGSSDTEATCSEGVLINEILPNPEGSDEGHEWIELVNVGGSPVNLEGWSLYVYRSEGSQSDYAFPEGTGIPAGGYLVVGGASAEGVDVVMDFEQGSGSDGDGVYLVCDGVVMDSVVYGNNNDDAVPASDLDGPAAQTWAPKPGDDEVLARCPDAADTNDSQADFSLLLPELATPGSTNETNCPCEMTSPSILLNELMPNPDGSDGGNEWLELYNAGTERVCVDGWTIGWYKGNAEEFNGSVTLPNDLWIDPHGFLLVGAGSTQAAVELDLGNGDEGDGVWLLDYTGACNDSIVYGASNEDGIMECSGKVATSLAPEPSSGESLARYPDGADSNDSKTDFCSQPSVTPGSPNAPCPD